MGKRHIFLSYRRDDVPGYVGRLADDLEDAFGKDRVFRDVDDIPGGTAWKQVIEQNLQQSAALILLIGPRWSDIWRARAADPVNYIAYELQLAKQHGVAVVPVSVGGARLASDLDLGDVSWIRERQVHDISDTQGRWQYDVAALIALLEKVDGLDGIRPSAPAASPQPSLWPRRIGLSLAVLLGTAALMALLGSDPEPGAGSGVEPKTVAREGATPADRQVVVTAPAEETATRVQARSRLDGVWTSKKYGTRYRIDAVGNGRFSISTPGQAMGEGRWMPKMPGKIEFRIANYGHGQFALSNSGPSMTGWIVQPGSSEQRFDTWTRSDE